MKTFIGFVKKGKNLFKAVTIYSNNGDLLYSFSGGYVDGGSRFDKFLDVFMWGIMKIKVLGQNKKIDENEKMFVFINSKTIYNWFEKETAPKLYIDKFSDILWELSFIVNEIEIIYSENLKLVLSSEDDNYLKVTDIFK